jgi:hypothetical protein
MAAGLGARTAGAPAVGLGCLYVGAAALIGSLTNRVAIRALFEPWPTRRFHLPYTGILESKRDEIEAAISEAVCGELISSHALAEGIRDSGLPEHLRDEAAERIRRLVPEPHEGQAAGPSQFESALAHSLAAMRRALDNDAVVEALGVEMHRMVEDAVESRECYSLVRWHVKRFGGTLGRIGHVTGIADYDEITYRLIDVVKSEMSDILRQPESLRGFVGQWLESGAQSLRSGEALSPRLRVAIASELRATLRTAADQLERWDVEDSRAVHELVRELVSRLDMRRVVNRSLARLSTGDMKDLVLRHSRHHLAWLEVWGAVLGALGGGALWAFSTLG